jgi:hypothetical protein
MIIEKPARTEIWVRKIYSSFVDDESLTTIFRPGRRLISENHPKALGVGELVRVRIVDQVGADWAGVYGTLLPQPNSAAVITDVIVKPFGTFSRSDFHGAPPSIQDNNELGADLALIYNLSRNELCASLWITRTTFRYISADRFVPAL